jgi:hypothetical protein
MDYAGLSKVHPNAAGLRFGREALEDAHFFKKVRAFVRSQEATTQKKKSLHL